MLKYRKTPTLLLFKPCRLLIHAWRHAYLLLLESIYRLKATLKIIMSVQWIYVLLDFGQYQIYFLSFYGMNPDCYFDIYFQVII